MGMLFRHIIVIFFFLEKVLEELLLENLDYLRDHRETRECNGHTPAHLHL